jgi:preprotein translocase subunit Sss1
MSFINQENNRGPLNLMPESEKKNMVFNFWQRSLKFTMWKAFEKSNIERIVMNLRSNSIEMSSVILKRAVKPDWKRYKIIIWSFMIFFKAFGKAGRMLMGWYSFTQISEELLQVQLHLIQLTIKHVLLRRMSAKHKRIRLICRALLNTGEGRSTIE